MTRHRFEEDANLTDKTTLSIDNIIYLLEFGLDATYFHSGGKYYKQIFGTGMGSPVSVTVANMVMENVEQRALSSLITSLYFGNNMLMTPSQHHQQVLLTVFTNIFTS